MDRIVRGEEVSAAENIEESAGYRTRAEFREMADRSGYRSLLNVALRKEGALLGVITIFRKEAGTYGKDTRGVFRIHQFNKIEQYVIARADHEESVRWHEQLMANSEELVQALELPYRVVNVCTGDMGDGKVGMYDLECWIPSEGRYRETHSCSYFHEWQARRVNIRYRDEDGKVKFVHTLNNTAIASPRILLPLFEVHQQPDGSVRIPEALRPFMGGQEYIRPQGDVHWD